MKKDINVALIGLGTVGAGVYKLLRRHRNSINEKVGAKVSLKAVLEKDKKRIRKLKVNPKLVRKDISSIVNDPQVDVVIEVIGGTNPAKGYILKALTHGKHVVTANKEVMASYGRQILEKAGNKGVDVFFEASVGGGIPIIRPLKTCLAGNKISRVLGIVNGTTNYILTKMSDEGLSFNQALKEAQRLGFAERDPRADIEGYDAAAKIAILASIAFNSRVTASQVYAEGIRKITPTDISYAREIGCTIKLIALAQEENGEIEVRVHPTMISDNHPLAAVRGVYNAIFVEGDAVGEVMFFGQGAGSMAAASAIVGDLIDISRNLQFERSGKIGCTCYERKKIRKIDDTKSCFYLLMNAMDRLGVLAKISKVFGDKNVSLASVIQKGPRGKNAELMFITHKVREKDLRRALSTIARLSVVNKILNIIRVEADVYG